MQLQLLLLIIIQSYLHLTLQLPEILLRAADSVYVSYQWYFNDSIIPSATKSYYVDTKSGNYNVAVYDIHGCSISVGINIIYHVGINELSSDNSISIFPNPASNQLFIHGDRAIENATLTIFNMIGERVLDQKILHSDHTSVDIENIAAGIYFIEIRQQESKWVGRFVKE